MARHDFTKHPNKCVFRVPTEEDIKFVAENMREADRKEMLRSTGLDPEWGLRQSVKCSDAVYTALSSRSIPLCIFGGNVTNLVVGEGCLWSLSTTEVDKRPVEFAVGSLHGVDRICRELPQVSDFCNWVDMEYKAAIHWIEWFGGDWELKAKRKGRFGSEFVKFYLPNPYYRED